MSYPQRGVDDGEGQVVAARLWAGGVATALVAAGIAFVGVVIINSIVGVGIQTVGRSGALIDNASTVIPLAAGIAALAATALLHLLLLSTPRPASFFSAIAVLVIVVGILQVFLADGPVAVHLATGVLYAGVGAAITSLLSGVSATSVRPAVREAYDGRYDARYGTPDPQVISGQPYLDGQPNLEDRTRGHDPHGRGR